MAGPLDSLEDAAAYFIPTFYGTSLYSFLLLGFIGSIADSLNHLVLTFPFLPSEGYRTLMETSKDHIERVIVFRGIPKLWLEYPIPNELREFWYHERPDILTFMQTNYPNINTLPDNLIF